MGTHARAVAFMEKVKYFSDAHLQAVNEALADLAEADGRQAQAIMEREVARSRLFHTEELEALNTWQGEPPEPSASGAGFDTASPRTKRSMQERLAAMGAVPALGGLMAAVPASRAGLTPTASPAARELLQRRLNCADGGVISSVGRGGSPAPSQPSSPGGGSSSPLPAWQTELKARRQGTPLKPAHAASESAVNNELAALFAKRQALN